MTARRESIGLMALKIAMNGRTSMPILYAVCGLANPTPISSPSRKRRSTSWAQRTLRRLHRRTGEHARQVHGANAGHRLADERGLRQRRIDADALEAHIEPDFLGSDRTAQFQSARQHSAVVAHLHLGDLGA